jgi:hypothetical protein
LINVPSETAVQTLADMADLKLVRRPNVLFVTTKEQAAALNSENEKRANMERTQTEKKKTAEEKPPAPAEQLEAAKEAYAEFGAEYDNDSPATQGIPCFKLPPSTTDANLKGLPNLPFRFGLNLHGTHVTDAGLKELKNLKNLTSLYVGDTQVTDGGMKELKVFKKLARLHLWSTKLTDKGLKELGEIKSLTNLSLYNTEVTDDGLNELKSLKNLVELNVLLTQVTDVGVQELHKTLPKCKILR